MQHINEIVDAIDTANDEFRWYYDSINKILVLASTYDYDGEYVFDIDEMESKDEMIALPDKYDIDEYQMMVDFSETYASELLELLHGKGVFRRFKDAVLSMGIEDKWYAFKKQKLTIIATQWCETHQLKCMSKDTEHS